MGTGLAPYIPDIHIYENDIFISTVMTKLVRMYVCMDMCLYIRTSVKRKISGVEDYPQTYRENRTYEVDY